MLTFFRSVTASVGISSLDIKNLIFIDPGVKINGSYYHNTPLQQHLLAASCFIAALSFTFQHCCQLRCWISSGCSTIQLTLQSGAFCKSKCTGSMMSTIWKNDWFTNSIVQCLLSDSSCFGHYNRSCLLTYWHWTAYQHSSRPVVTAFA